MNTVIQTSGFECEMLSIRQWGYGYVSHLCVSHPRILSAYMSWLCWTVSMQRIHELQKGRTKKHSAIASFDDLTMHVSFCVSCFRWLLRAISGYRLLVKFPAIAASAFFPPCVDSFIYPSIRIDPSMYPMIYPCMCASSSIHPYLLIHLCIICPSIYRVFLCPSTHACIHLSIYPCIYSSIYSCMCYAYLSLLLHHASIHPSVYRVFLCNSSHACIHLPCIHASIHPFIYPSTSLHAAS